MRKTPYFRILGAFLLVLGASSSVLRAQLVANALSQFDSLIQNYNILTSGSLTLSGTHTDGSIAAGGTLTIAGGSVIAMSSSATSSSSIGIYANSNIVISGTSQINNGYVVAPNLSSSVAWSYSPANNDYQRNLLSSTGSLNYNTNSSQAYSDPRTVSGNLDFSSTFSDLSSVSSTLSSATSNGTISISGQTLVFSSTLSGTTVFSLDASRISGNYYDINGDGRFDQNTERFTSIATNIADGQSFVINATTTAAASLFSNVNFNGGSNVDDLLWNITPSSSSSTLVLGSNVYGSILAPSVSIVSNNYYVNGQIAAASYSQTGAEVHYVAFSAVPEPSTYALGAVMLGAGVAVWRRRRQSTNQAA